MAKATSIELRRATIEAVRTQAHLALSDKYLDTSNTNRPCRWRGTPNDEKRGYFQSKSDLYTSEIV